MWIEGDTGDTKGNGRNDGKRSDDGDSKGGQPVEESHQRCGGSGR